MTFYIFILYINTVYEFFALYLKVSFSVNFALYYSHVYIMLHFMCNGAKELLELRLEKMLDQNYRTTVHLQVLD